MTMFQKAERRKAKARIGICGPAGSGKTYSALKLAFGLAPGGKIAVLDTEHGSAELYADLGDYDCATMEPPYTVERYIEAIEAASSAGYDVLILDSITHAWAGTGGLLERQQKITQASSHKNSYMAWGEITPLQEKFIEAMLGTPCHLITTMRTKTEYVLQENSRGKKVPTKVGMAPIQRDGMDYNFTIVFDIEQEKHYATVSKDRTDLFNGFTDIISESHGHKIREWLEGGTDKPAQEPVKEKTDNYKFLEAAATEKKRVGDEAYYKVLGGMGFTKSNEITDRENQKKFYEELKGLDDV
jgi:hypothetical protein